jgi:drug/metabolite transporter (DMT)-like permease
VARAEGALAVQEDDSGQRSGVLLATLAVCLFSLSPVLVAWGAPLNAFVMTAGRLGVGALAVWGMALIAGQPLFPARSDLLRFTGFGLAAALHFLSYIASLGFTTIAQSLALVYTAPIFVTIFSAIFLHEPIARRKWLGALITVAGIAVMVGFEAQMSPQMLFGDGLALVSAISFGIYSVAGRSQRGRYPLFTYAGTVYFLAALWVLPTALLTFAPGEYATRSVMAVVLSGLLPLATGHTLYNAALRRTHATTVNLIASQEVTGGVLLGWLLLGQAPQPNEIAGIAMALSGIAVVLR